MTKIRAFVSHLGISFIIFLTALYIIIFKWYPGPFFTTDGGWQGIRIMAGVDLVLGPLLTLIVFKPGKPGLKFDLTIIGFIQAVALLWGSWIVHHERPFAAVYSENYFATVTYYDVANKQQVNKKITSLGETRPYWVFNRLPQGSDNLLKARITALKNGHSLFQMGKYYEPIDSTVIKQIEANSIDMQKWLKLKNKDREQASRIYREFMRKHGHQSRLVFIPWHGRKKYKIIAFDTDKMRYAGSLNITPPDVSGNFPRLGDRASLSASN